MAAEFFIKTGYQEGVNGQEPAGRMVDLCPPCAGIVLGGVVNTLLTFEECADLLKQILMPR